MDNTSVTGRLCTLVFNIKEDAATGSYPITMDLGRDCNIKWPEEDVPTDFIFGKVTVCGASVILRILTFLYHRVSLATFLSLHAKSNNYLPLYEIAFLIPYMFRNETYKVANPLNFTPPYRIFFVVMAIILISFIAQ